MKRCLSVMFQSIRAMTRYTSVRPAKSVHEPVSYPYKCFRSCEKRLMSSAVTREIIFWLSSLPSSDSFHLWMGCGLYSYSPFTKKNSLFFITVYLVPTQIFILCVHIGGTTKPICSALCHRVYRTSDKIALTYIKRSDTHLYLFQRIN